MIILRIYHKIMGTMPCFMDVTGFGWFEWYENRFGNHVNFRWC